MTLRSLAGAVVVAGLLWPAAADAGVRCRRPYPGYAHSGYAYAAPFYVPGVPYHRYYYRPYVYRPYVSARPYVRYYRPHFRTGVGFFFGW